jgi:hypothetical protein
MADTGSAGSTAEQLLAAAESPSPHKFTRSGIEHDVLTGGCSSSFL